MAASPLADDISGLYSVPFSALGSELLSGVVSLLYEKLFQHDETRRFFEGKDRKKIQRHMAGFLSCALARSSNPALSPKQVWFIHRHMLRGYQPLAPFYRCDRAAEPAEKCAHTSQSHPPQRHTSLPELEFLGAGWRELSCVQHCPSCPESSHNLQVQPRSASALPADAQAAAAAAVGQPSLQGLCTALSDEHHCAALFSRDSCSSTGSFTGSVVAGSPDSCCADSCPAAAKSYSTQGEGASHCPKEASSSYSSSPDSYPAAAKSFSAQGEASQRPGECPRAGNKQKPSVSFSGDSCPLPLSSSAFRWAAEECTLSHSNSSTVDTCPFAAKAASPQSEGAHSRSTECPYAGLKQRPSVSFSGIHGEAESCPMASREAGRVHGEDALGPRHAHVMMLLLRDTLAELGAEQELSESMSAFLAQSSHVFERGDFFFDPHGREAEWQRAELEKKVRQQPVARKLEGTRSKSFNSKSGLPKLSRMGNMCTSRSALSCTNLTSRHAQEEQEKAEKTKEDMRAMFSSW